MQTLLGRHWHHLESDKVVELLDSDAQSGLDLFEINHRQQRFGPNQLTPKKGKSGLLRFLLQFNNPLIYILLASSLITAFVKDVVDAAIIFGVVLVNAVIGFIQESKAEKAIEALAKAMTTEATVLRSAKTQRIPAAELVPGDIVLLNAGDRLPADLRLLRARDLQVAEAALTGESLPVQKQADLSLPPDTILAERRNMAYASTLVTYGQGSGIVIATGDSTEIGRISTLIAGAHELVTPLNRKIARFSNIILYIILALAAVAFGIGVWRDQPPVDTFTAAIALAVAMIPEGLPAALTVTLAIGVSRMARRRAIIRKLPAVETLGSVTVICSDKTGTLTQNQMTVQHVYAGRQCYEVKGSGYNPDGKIYDQDGNPISQPPYPLAECLTAGLLCNDSQLIETGAGWQAQGDPTETALITSALKGGLSADGLRAALPRLDSIPFDSQHQFMASLHSRAAGGAHVVYLKGAVEVLLDRCANALTPDGGLEAPDREAVHRHVDEMAGRGLRVLAFARLELPHAPQTLSQADIAAGLTFLGLQGMIDPPRPEAIAAVKACQQAGVRVKMITGDHVLTASAIARQLELNGLDEASDGQPAALSGKELARLTDAELIEVAERTAVFARVSPEQKLKLVEAMQARGHIVAMTGDGVNDGPALKQADIGIAMGITGTDVAKEAADMVLTDDNFATIEAAVEEGRGVFDNLTKIIAWTLPTNLGGGLIILAALLLGVTLPILPIQVLWINMTTVGILGTVLAIEGKEPNVMKRPPRDPQAAILTKELLWRIVLVGALILLGAFGLYELELMLGASIAEARTMAVNVVVFVQVFYLFNCRSLSLSMFQVGLLSNPWMTAGVAAMAALQILYTYLPAMNRLFSSAPVSLTAWAEILAISAGSYAIIELEKWLRRHKKAAAPQDR